MGRVMFLGLFALAACGGAPDAREKQPLTASVAVAGSGGVASSAAGAANGGAVAETSHAGQPAGGAGGTGESVAGSGGLPVTGAAGANDAGAAGAAPIDPDCDRATYRHARPLKCQPRQAVNCDLPGGGCTGDGFCADSKHMGLVCNPITGEDHSLCSDGSVRGCQAGTCGATGNVITTCDQVERDSVPEVLCPCAVVGVIGEPSF